MANIRDLALIGRERLIAAQTWNEIWLLLNELIQSVDAGLVVGPWRQKIDESAVPEEPLELVGKMLARFQDRVHATIADSPIAASEILVYTIFGSKGQQWRHVFIVGAYSQGFQDGVAADGLRKLYVTLTRSMQRLLITLPRLVGFTVLAKRLPSVTPGFTPELSEAIAACHIPVEVDP